VTNQTFGSAELFGKLQLFGSAQMTEPFSAEHITFFFTINCIFQNGCLLHILEMSTLKFFLFLSSRFSINIISKNYYKIRKLLFFVGGVACYGYPKRLPVVTQIKKKEKKITHHPPGRFLLQLSNLHSYCFRLNSDPSNQQFSQCYGKMVWNLIRFLHLFLSYNVRFLLLRFIL
jgi:hypothetical protein